MLTRFDLNSITWFIQNMGLPRDLNVEVFEYFNGLNEPSKMDVLFIEINDAACDTNCLYQKQFKHDPNRTDFIPIIKHIFEILEDDFYYGGQYECTIDGDNLTMQQTYVHPEDEPEDPETYSLQKLAEYLKEGNLNEQTFPFEKYTFIRDMNIKLYTQTLDEI